MASNTKPIGPLIGALFDSVTPKGQDKLRAKRSMGEKSVTEPNQQHGELASAMEPKPLSDRAQIKEHARSEKTNATKDWVAGRISTKQHSAVHKRANHVLASKEPRAFKGMNGEKSMKLGHR
jgi:hypothetical protein